LIHPVLSRRSNLAVYLLVWLPVALLLAAIPLLSWSKTEALSFGFILAFLAAGLCLSSYYVTRAVNLNNRPPLTVAATWGIASLFVSGLWCASAWLLSKLLESFFGLTRLPTLMRGAAPYLAVFGVLLYLASLAFYSILQVHERLGEMERQGAQLRLLAQEAELKALRAQLNPHFLFNSLNSISALTSLDAAKAREMCVLLSDFLRKSLGLGERREVRLAEELELARAYLAIEQIRFGSRLQVLWEIQAGLDDALVPPLLFQPLVENAIKHGISQVSEGGTIRVSVQANDQSIEAIFENPADEDARPRQGLGMGLRQVRQRLLGRFPRAYFDAESQNGKHRVRLRFPFETELS
jgi:two-component system, LytTR family, sensor histidine kinase AlgZ